MSSDYRFLVMRRRLILKDYSGNTLLPFLESIFLLVISLEGGGLAEYLIWSARSVSVI